MGFDTIEINLVGFNIGVQHWDQYWGSILGFNIWFNIGFNIGVQYWVQYWGPKYWGQTILG